MSNPQYSVVIPVHNEEENVTPLYQSLKSVMDTLETEYEVLFIDDGSDDQTAPNLKSLQSKDIRLKIITFDVRRGKSAAMQAGFDTLKGRIVITMDGDRQNDPDDIPKMIAKLNEGYDVVCGWRHQRIDSKIKLITSKIGNVVRKWLSRERIHDVGCMLRVFKRECLKDVYLTGPLHRFFTFIMTRLGFSITEMKVKHHARIKGDTKYNTWNRLPESIAALWMFAFYDIREEMRRERKIGVSSP